MKADQFELLSQQVSVLTQAVHAMLRVTQNKDLPEILERHLLTYEAVVMASPASEKSIEKLRELNQSLLRASRLLNP